MEKPKLIIKKKKYRGESTIVSMRIPREMLEDIDTVVKATGRTRNEILATALEFALDHMEISEEANHVIK